MFGSKKSKQDNSQSPSVNAGGGRNVISSDTKIVGEVIAEGDFRIEGTLEGTLVTKGRVIVGKSGLIEGKIECNSAEVHGKFAGDLTVHDTLSVKSTAIITGDVVVGQISTESGAKFNANCNMRGMSTVKDLSNTSTKGKSVKSAS